MRPSIPSLSPRVPACLRAALALLPLLAFVFLLSALPTHAQVVINEILYRPGTGYPENPGLEFIEFHNPTDNPVSMGGWALTSGVGFTFPPTATIPPGGYVVVASNPALVQNTYGISGVLGPWDSSAGLSNNSEKVTLSKPGAAIGSWDVVDTVTYANEGDWGNRVREATFGGWTWQSAADLGNRSIELRNPALSNDNGQNWLPSTAFARATPLAPNSVLTSNVPPIISGVTHSPAVPTSAQNVTVSCQVADELAPALLTSTLHWRDATTGTPGAFTAVPMAGNGTGRFTGTIGARANLSIVEFYVSVSDGVHTRTWPAPTNEGQNANCQYLVTNEVRPGADAYYYLVLTAAENTAFNNAPNNSDRVFNQTLIVVNGTDTTIRYRAGMRIRGNSSRNYQFRPLRITIPNDQPFDDYTGFNLAPRAPHLQFIGQRLMQAAGIHASDTIPVELRRNGVESTTNSGSTPDFGKWARVEDEGREFVKRHWPEGEDTGNFYKKIDNGAAWNYYWRSSGWTVPNNPDTVMDGYNKQNNSGANDWSDLTTFFSVMQSTAAPHFPTSSPTNVAGSNNTRQTGNGNWAGTALDDTQLAAVETVADLDQWARWFAAMTIIQTIETNVSNGVDDDYGIYFAPGPNGTRRAQMVAHDLDTIFGLGDTVVAFNGRGLYDATDNNHVFRTLLPLFGTNLQPGNAAFRQKYHDAIRSLYGGTVFNADTTQSPNPPFYRFVDELLTGWAPPATITSIKTFATNRQAYLLGLIGTGAITPPPATARTSVSVAGGDVIIHEILARNTSAHNNAGTFPGVIELHNRGALPFDLSGMSISNDPALPSRYVFPAGTTIAAGGYLVVYADVPSAAPGLHTGFILNGDGGGVYLFDTLNNGRTLIDSVAYGLQASNYSIGRSGTGLTNWTLCTPSIGNANTPVVTFAEPGGLRINEWAARPDYLLDDDFIELYNPGTSPVALGGMRISDDPVGNPGKFNLPDLSFMGPGSFVAFIGKGGSAIEGVATELPFGLDSNFGSVALFGANGTLVDRREIVAQAADTSRGRSPDGGGTIATFGPPSSLPSPGAPNATPSANLLALVQNLRVSELLYAPNNLEYIELHNTGGTSLNLAGVRFTRGVTYTFENGVSIPAGGYLVVCRDRTAFQNQFGLQVPLAPGTFTGSLDNSGENITLRTPLPWDLNILDFAYSGSWYSETSSNFSLTLANPAGTAARDWNQKSAWTGSPALYGTPGGDSAPTITSDLSVTAIRNVPFSYQITASKNPTSLTASALPDGLTFDAGTGVISGTPTTVGTTPVTLTATNAIGTGSRILNLTVANPPPPSVLSGSSATAYVGIPFTYQIAATENPTEYSAAPLPANLHVDPVTGVISGTPIGTGVTHVTVFATNAWGTGFKQVSITVVIPPKPVITSPAFAGTVVGDVFNYQILSENFPTSYAADGLPPGLEIDTTTGFITGTATVPGTYGVTLSATNAAGTTTRSLTLFVATSGSLAQFIWAPIGDVPGNLPFAVTITAKDSQGRTVDTFQGSANIGPALGRVLITELGVGGTDYFEFQNVGNIPANTTGWFIVPNNAAGTGGGLNAVNAPWPLPETVPPGVVVAVNELTASVYPTQIDWTINGSNSGWLMLCDETGAVRDFVVWGYSAAQVAAINVPSITVNGTTYNNLTVPPELWTGNALPVGANAVVKTRVGSSDNNVSSDWTVGTSESNKGLKNTALILPFTGSTTPGLLTPSSATFANGVFSGNLVFNELRTGLQLVADGGSGRTGISAPFNVVPPPLPIITSPSTARGVVGGPFSYQILATNSPGSFGALNLPDGLIVQSTSGLLAGTPTAPGSTVVSIGATNLGGTGYTSLTVDIEADADGDGMGDAWESSHGLSPALADGDLDLDGDGQSNLSEWLSGSAPNDPASAFAITQAQIVGSDFVLTWSSTIGKRYRVLTRTDFANGTWTSLTPQPITATETSITFTHVGGANAGARFYRVAIEQ